MKNKSQKGKWGHVGAPPKEVKFPKGSFTMERAVTLNKGVCALTVRKRVTAAVVGFYVSNGKRVTVPKSLKIGEAIRQPKGGVGRPKFRFVPLGTPVKATKTVKTVAPKLAVKPAVKRTVTTKTVTPIVNVTTPAASPAPVTTPAVTTPAQPEVPATVVTPSSLP